MTRFLYFIPDVRGVRPDDLVAAGLHHIADASFSFRNCEAGPEGKQGCIAAIDGGDTEPGWFPDRQHWMQCADGRFHLGWEDPPGPDDLKRQEIVPGHTAVLADGNEWIVPLARAFPEGTELPHALILGPGGALTAEILPRFVSLSRQAEEVYEALLLQERELTVEKAWRIAVDALSVNYRVGPWELSALRVLTTETVRTVLGHLIDLPSILEAADAAGRKKKAAVEECSRGGSSV